jgi:PilZ domain
VWKFLERLGPEPPQRKPRFCVEIQVNFRKIGDFAWSQGKTENLSRSGILFRTGKPLVVDTPVEIQFVAPRELEENGSLVACRGRIVRLDNINPQEHRLSMAARFKQYEVLRRADEW